MVRVAMARAVAWGVRLVITVAGVALVGWALLPHAHWAERHVLPSYCATTVSQRVIARAVPWAAAALGAVAALVVAPAAARSLRRASPRAAAASLAGVIAAAVASLGVAELYMRRQHERLALGMHEAPDGRQGLAMTRVEPRLGWSYFPERITWVEIGGRRISYAIDAEGDRAASTAALPDPARPTILVAGESIAFGYGLPYEETFPFLVGRDLGIQTVNLAVVGYGNDQAYLRTLDALARYRDPVAVLTLFIPAQIRRNVDPWRPRLAVGRDGALARVPPSGGPRVAKLLHGLPYHGDDALRVTAAILRATAEAARDRGAYPLFVVTNYGPPCVHPEGEEAWIVDELFVRQALPFVRVDLEPDDDLLSGLLEQHPSARGARKIADAVERALSERARRPPGSHTSARASPP